MRRVYKILEITRDGARPVAGEIVPRRCERCGGVWAQVRLLPYLVPRDYIPWEKFEAAIVRTGRSRSGAHYARLDGQGEYYALPTRPHGGQEYVILGDLRVAPAVYADGRALVIWTEDIPFGHEAALVGFPRGRWDLDGEPDRIPECGSCFRKRAIESPDYMQGHLYVLRESSPRLSPSGEGVDVTYGPPNAYSYSKQFFNHNISIFPASPPSGYIAIRGDIATVWALKASVRITSPDHPGQDIILVEDGEVVLNMYHPWPRPERAVD